MPRKRLPIVSTDPYHISIRCVNREKFCLPLPTVWSIMEDYLYLLAVTFDVRIHAFVLMSNHFHLIISAPAGNMGAALLYFLRETSKQMNRLAGKIDQNYGCRNHKTRIADPLYFMNTYRYIYRNPVRAGICELVENYPYSTLPGLLGLRKLVIPLAEDTLLFNPNFDSEALNWLNRAPAVEQEEAIRRALRRSEFELKANQKTGKMPTLDVGWRNHVALLP